MKKTLIISGFPGIGKTHYMKLHTPFDEVNITKKVIELNLDDYKWERDKNGEKTRLKQSAYPENYINDIFDMIDKDVDVLFVSSDKEIRTILRSKQIDFYTIIPTSKYTTLQRLHMKKEEPEVINKIIAEWDKLTNEIMIHDYKVIVSDADIVDIVDDILKERSMTFETKDYLKEKELADIERQERRNLGNEIDFDAINAERRYWGMKEFVKKED